MLHKTWFWSCFLVSEKISMAVDFFFFRFLVDSFSKIPSIGKSWATDTAAVSRLNFFHGCGRVALLSWKKMAPQKKESMEGWNWCSEVVGSMFGLFEWLMVAPNWGAFRPLRVISRNENLKIVAGSSDFNIFFGTKRNGEVAFHDGFVMFANILCVFEVCFFFFPRFCLKEFEWKTGNSWPSGCAKVTTIFASMHWPLRQSLWVNESGGY